MLREFDATAPDFKAELGKLLARDSDGNRAVTNSVAAIIADIAKRGDEALLEYTEKFDRHKSSAADLRVTAAEISAAAVAPEAEQALQLAAGRIKAFHVRALPQGFEYADELGIRLGQRWTAVDSAGIYVPGGLAAYPSSVLMNAIPASVAGVGRLVMAVPAPDGKISPAVLVAARIAGVSEIYKIGGAQAIAALAFGTATIARVDKIAGPGNAYVAEAKRQLYGVVGIDSVAGPSEILVVADASANARWVAADLLSQAEHDTSASSILITDSRTLAAEVQKAVAEILATLPRAEIASASIKNHGAIIIVPGINSAPEIINIIAPEHLELMVANPDALVPDIKHAGALFIGHHTPESLGDYIAGPSHVLPTSGTAKFSSGLSVMDFMKRSSIISASPAAMEKLRPATETLAEAEGLQAHGLAAKLRRAL